MRQGLVGRRKCLLTKASLHAAYYELPRVCQHRHFLVFLQMPPEGTGTSGTGTSGQGSLNCAARLAR